MIGLIPFDPRPVAHKLIGLKILQRLIDLFEGIHHKRAMLHDWFVQRFTADHDKTRPLFSRDKIESIAVSASRN